MIGRTIGWMMMAMWLVLAAGPALAQDLRGEGDDVKLGRPEYSPYLDEG